MPLDNTFEIIVDTVDVKNQSRISVYCDYNVY